VQIHHRHALRPQRRPIRERTIHGTFVALLRRNLFFLLISKPLPLHLGCLRQGWRARADRGWQRLHRHVHCRCRNFFKD
jgi:hypothetical protein